MNHDSEDKWYSHMPSTILWRLMYRVNDRSTLDKCLERTLAHFGNNAELGECKPYWKIPELWECTIRTHFESGTIADHVVHCLTIATRLASGWYVSGNISPENSVGFFGVFAKGKGHATDGFLGLEWASFDVLSN
jgi:hypothetical protein